MEYTHVHITHKQNKTSLSNLQYIDPENKGNNLPVKSKTN